MLAAAGAHAADWPRHDTPCRRQEDGARRQRFAAVQQGFVRKQAELQAQLEALEQQAAQHGASMAAMQQVSLQVLVPNPSLRMAHARTQHRLPTLDVGTSTHVLLTHDSDLLCAIDSSMTVLMGCLTGD